MMNVDKWVQMINNRDYTAAFNVLDSNFRNNKFGDVEEFENYMRENYPLHYKAQYSDYTEENGTYTLDILLIDVTGKDNEQKQITAIMQLKDNYEFVMSFNVEEQDSGTAPKSYFFKYILTSFFILYLKNINISQKGKLKIWKKKEVCAQQVGE